MSVLVIQDHPKLLDTWAQCVKTANRDYEKILGTTAASILKQLRVVLGDVEEPFQGTLLDFLYHDRTNAYEIFAGLNDEERGKLGPILLVSNSQKEQLETLIEHPHLDVRYLGAPNNADLIISGIRNHT